MVDELHLCVVMSHGEIRASSDEYHSVPEVFAKVEKCTHFVYWSAISVNQSLIYIKHDGVPVTHASPTHARNTKILCDGVTHVIYEDYFFSSIMNKIITAIPTAPTHQYF